MKWDSKLFRLHLTTRRFGREFVYLEEAESTNEWLLSNLDEFTLTGGAVLADHQTAGRGRFDRRWHDVPGTSILVSVLFRRLKQRDTAWLTMLPAIATAEVLAAQISDSYRVSLKWPNDILLNDRKIGGVLGQTTVRGEETTSVVGLGLNVNVRNSDFPDAVRQSATSLLHETKVEYAREPLLALILARWEELFDVLLEERGSELRERWERFGPRRGTVLMRTESGVAVSGHFEGLGDQGQLRLRDDFGNLSEVFTGEVST